MILTKQINLYLNDFKCYSLKKAPSFFIIFLSYFFYNFFWIFKFRNKIYQKISKFHFPVTNGNEIFTEIPPILLTLFPIRPWRGAGDGDGSGEPCLSGDRRRSRWAVGRGMQIEVEMSGTQVRVGIGINRNRKMDIWNIRICFYTNPLDIRTRRLRTSLFSLVTQRDLTKLMRAGLSNGLPRR